MLDYQYFEPEPVQRLQAKTTRQQIHLTRILGSSLPKLNLPRELVKAVKDNIIQEWLPTLSVHESAVLKTLLALTIERDRRNCVIALVQSALSHSVVNRFEAETYGGGPQENHKRAVLQLVEKGFVDFTICDEGWICSINFLWEPDLQSICTFAASGRDEID